MTNPRIKITMLNVEPEHLETAMVVVTGYIEKYASPERVKQYNGVSYSIDDLHFYAWGDETHVRIKQTS